MTLRAEVVASGDELIHGSALDTNSKWIAQQLEAQGLAVQRFAVVGDEPGPFRDALRSACERADVVIVTGGLGPTLDDRTRDVAAELLGGVPEFDAQSWQWIQDWLTGRGRPVPDSNRRQALLPPGARALANPVGTAPGFAVRIGKAMVYALPGVPREMKRMLQDHVVPAVAQMPGLRPVAQHCLRVLGPSEAALGERIAAWMVPGRDPAVGINASGGLLTIRIVGGGATAGTAADAVAATAAELRPLLGAWLFAEGTAELPELVLDRLRAHGHVLATAESCTGGKVAAALVDVPGASAAFAGGVVAYSNASKTALLGVPAELVSAHGAVSEPVAAAMAEGARVRFAATHALATTGIAGPDGGTADKPVGTVCFALATAAGTRAWTLKIPDLGREFVRDRAVFECFRALLS